MGTYIDNIMTIEVYLREYIDIHARLRDSAPQYWRIFAWRNLARVTEVSGDYVCGHIRPNVVGSTLD